MFEAFLRTLREDCGISSGDRLLVGVSGGVDSIALMNLLAEAGCLVVVGLLDHGLRDSSSDEAEFVRRAAEKLSLTFVSERVDTEAFANEGKLSLEEAARDLRYRFLFRTAEVQDCQAVAVGHHAGDQAETILLHLVRGSGLKGLRGMSHWRKTHWHSVIPLVRPLLHVPKADLAEYCKRRNLGTIEDESNQDTRYLRNRIRRELLPILEEMNPNIVERLGKTGDVIRDELFLLDEITNQFWAAVDGDSDGSVVSFSRDKFLDLNRGLTRRLMRHAMDIMRPGLVDVGFDLVERAVDFVASPPESGETDLAQGLRLVVGEKVVRIAEWDMVEDLSGYPQISGELQIPLREQGVYPLSGDWEIAVEPAGMPEMAAIESNQDRFAAYLDLGVETAGSVRARMDGDRISPLGMGDRSMKLSDLMINQGIPRAARGAWPVFEIGGEIVWVPGCRSAESARVNPDSSRVVKIIFRQKS